MSFSDIPAELLLMVLGHAVAPDDPAADTVSALITRSLALKSVCSRFRAAISTLLSQQFHCFHAIRTDDLQAQIGPWTVSIHSEGDYKRWYWRWYQGGNFHKLDDPALVLRAFRFTSLPVLRALSLDLRIIPLHPDLPACWARLAPDRFNAGLVLTRILMGCQALEELNIRLPPHQELIGATEHLVANNRSLRHITIEIDSGNVRFDNDRPIVRLENMVECGDSYKALLRFVIRAPSAVIAAGPTNTDEHRLLMSRLSQVRQLGLAGSEFASPEPSLTWLGNALGRMSALQACQFSFSYRQDLATYGVFQHDASSIALPYLTDLTVEVEGANTLLFSKIQSPHLYALRFRTSVHVRDWHPLDANHFPSLFTATSWAPGPSAQKLEALGIPIHKYIHNLTSFHNSDVDHNTEFTAYIKPYGRLKAHRTPPAAAAHVAVAASASVAAPRQGSVAKRRRLE
ncbi:hypothetical protein OC842_001675 [Tilletia horrida]|uniref:F-box domain-containing protein n=1 Tax=Tilletia horrida TaxID=155126 RepID=A0AAN6GEL0_9BASI|nr:hypothetical protein OC842_001675 [Tilletia horrida]